MRAKLIDEAVEYQWSSAKAHVSGADPERLLELEWWKELCPLDDWAAIVKPTRYDEQEAKRIRMATRAGEPLGDEEFVGGLERSRARRLRKNKPGPKPVRWAASAAKAATG